ncbi:MAG: PTS lactose/cellobiose transporter subunit IIA [Clostridium sp.]|uniref:PTS lactose/cellobiose transporter subunit IIA n=1 Tax=Clostridium sp. TaxID=1506 RepID=UPI003F400A30
MANLNMEEIIFEIIGNAGEAKGLAYEALQAAEKGEYERAENLLKESDEALLNVHAVQTKLIQEEAAGNNVEVSLLMVHAQDHLMTSIEAKTLIEGMIKLYKKIDEK